MSTPVLDKGGKVIGEIDLRLYAGHWDWIQQDIERMETVSRLGISIQPFTIKEAVTVYKKGQVKS